MDYQLGPITFLGFVMFIAFASGILLQRAGIPRVAVYVIVGALFSRSLLGRWFPDSAGQWNPILTDVSLALIAYLVGAEIHLKEVHRQERSVIAIALGQLIAVWALVTVSVWAYSRWTGGSLQFNAALVLGSIATATAPAATIAVINEYKARGKVSDILLGVVAVDDAFGIIAFTLAIGIIGQETFVFSLVTALKEIGGSLVLGALIGVVLGLLGRWIKEEDLRLPLIIAAVFVTAGLSTRLELSMLLACMTLGLVSKSLFRGKTEQWLSPSNHIRELIFLVFFVLAGLHFRPGVFAQSVGLIAIYTAARSLGKIGGAGAASAIVGASDEVRSYIGYCLLPQAGVAIGLALKAIQDPALRDVGATLMSIVLSSTILFALAAPLATRWALARSGELNLRHGD